MVTEKMLPSTPMTVPRLDAPIDATQGADESFIFSFILAHISFDMSGTK
jgi:hypothetical protein